MIIKTLQDFVICISGMLALVLVLGMIQGSSDLSRYLELKSNLINLHSTVNKIEKENEVLDTEIHRIKTSPLYARKVLKDRYHVVEDNEDIIFFPD